MSNKLIENSINSIELKTDNLINDIYKNKFININSIDMVSIIIEYVKEFLLERSLLKFFHDLEGNKNLVSIFNTFFEKIKEKQNKKNIDLEKTNEILKKKIKNLENNINNNKLNQEIKDLKDKIEKLEMKEKELNELKSKLPFELAKNEKIMFIIFKSMNEEIIYPIICKNTDTLLNLEDKLYNEFPEYKKYNFNYIYGGKKIDKLETLEENKIINNDIITIVW